VINELEKTISLNIRKGLSTMIPPCDRASTTVSGDFLVELLRARGYHEKGLVIIGATITESFDCSDLEVTAPIRLLECRFRKPIKCSRANLYLLDLSDSSLPGFVIDKATITHGLLLCRTSITAEDPTSPVIDGALLKVNGDVDLTSSHINGEVRLHGTVIGGGLHCEGATLSNKNGVALRMSRAEVKSSVYFTDGFRATGEVRLLGTVIGGGFYCTGAALSNENSVALRMDRAEVKSSVFFQGGFSATGKVRLLGTVIGGGFYCKGAKLENEKGVALTMDGVDVKGSVFFEICSINSEKSQRTISLKGSCISGIRLLLKDKNIFKDSRLDTCLLLDEASYQMISVENPEDPDTTTDNKKSSSLHTYRKKFVRWLKCNGTLHQFPGGVYASLLSGQKSGNKTFPATYDTAARVLRGSGEEQLAKELLLEKNRQLRNAKGKSGKFVGWLFDITVGYGYRPLLALPWVGGIYLIAVIIFWLASHHSGIVATPLAGTKGFPSVLKSSSSYPSFSAWNYAFGAFFTPFVHLPGIQAWRSNAVNGWGISVRVMLWVEPIILWALAITLGASLAGIVRRDKN